MNAELRERNIATVQFFLDGTHSPDLSDLKVIDTTVHPDIVCHGFPGGDPHDRESYKDWFRTFRASFTDMDFQIQRLIADDFHVAVHWQVAVTHSGEFAGFAATERRVRFDGMVIYRLVDGLIAETWLGMDQLGLLSQIGAVQIPTEAA